MGMKGGHIFRSLSGSFDLLAGDPSIPQVMMTSYASDVTAAANRIKQWSH